MFNLSKTNNEKRSASAASIRKLNTQFSNGNIKAAFQLGNLMEKCDRNEEAAQWYIKAAEMNYTLAQYRLGEIYMEGLGVARNVDQAQKWFLAAAKNGLDSAQFFLAEILRLGISASGQQLEEALHWYEEAAKQGNQTAIERIRQRERNDIHWAIQNRTDRDPAISEAKNPLVDASAELLYEAALEYQAMQDYGKAAQYCEAAASKGLADAQHLMGKLYMAGDGVDKNYSAAFAWFTKATAQNNKEATFAIARFYDNGITIEKNEVKANSFFKKAALLGHSQAIETLKRRGIKVK